MAYAREKQVSIAAVLKACLATRRVQAELVSSGGSTKRDRTPVTVADYTSQALISALIFSTFPHDEIVAEEETGELGTDAATKARIVRLANEAMEEVLEEVELEAEWAEAKRVRRGEREWMELIDRGNSAGGCTRHWALDPIDGTKGFLRGDQYAVCLGLIVRGEVVLGVTGCPNLPVDLADPTGEKGVIFVAVKGEGAFARSLSSPLISPISMSPLTDVTLASFCESIEGSSDHLLHARIGQILGITKPTIKMDSQAKYCSIARGFGDVYLRLPLEGGFIDGNAERIWDHSSGALLVGEAGGVVSDMNGKPLDFSLGRTLRGNVGMVAAAKGIHAAVIQAVRLALKAS